MSIRTRVGVIFGGRSGEHEVSLNSARTVVESLDRDRYEVVPIGITKDGRWLFDGDPLATLNAAAGTIGLPDGPATQPRLVPATPAIHSGALDGRQLDVVIPMVHGTYGEDGTIQGLLELAGIPYVGPGVLASAVGMDKAVMKDLFLQHHIPIVKHVVVMRKDWRGQPEETTAAIEREIGCPCFVKPANMGSSVGISKATTGTELRAGLEEAAQYDRKIVVERAVEDCREIEVGVIGNDDPIVSLPGEVIVRSPFYDYAAKYTAGGSDFVVPAALSPELTAEVQALAKAAFQTLGCAGMARVDCFISRGDRRVYVNEVNTIPGMTPTSMFHRLWEASGIGTTELLTMLITFAMERHEERAGLRTSYVTAREAAL